MSKSKSTPPDYIVNPKTGCWEWQRCKRSRKEGYGWIWRDGKGHQAHRWYYEHYKGLIPVGLTIDHLCKNPSCVNPDHLEAVPMATNARRGCTVKLTMAKAHEIRDLSAAGWTQELLAQKYGVSGPTICLLLAGKTWQEATC